MVARSQKLYKHTIHQIIIIVVLLPFNLLTLTNEINSFREELRKVLAPVIRDGNLLVVEVAILLKEVWEVWSHIEDVVDSQFGQSVHVGRVTGTSQVEIG